MFGKRRDLIVPVRDRRQRKRYLTLKNFGKVSLVAAVVFAGITIRSEMRDPEPGYYGNLYQKQVPPVEPKKPVEVVTEAPPAAVPDETHADPMLMAPAARAQWLEGETGAPAVAVTTMPRAEASVATGETRVAIVGGTDGVSVVQQTRRRPVLEGGFGRR